MITVLLIWLGIGIFASILEFKYSDSAVFTLTDFFGHFFFLPLLGLISLFAVMEERGRDIVLWKRK
jgi:hypothetical protein